MSVDYFSFAFIDFIIHAKINSKGKNQPTHLKKVMKNIWSLSIIGETKLFHGVSNSQVKLEFPFKILRNVITSVEKQVNKIK